MYHSAVVDEYRDRERLLRERHGYDVHLICPPRWIEGGVDVVGKSDADVPVHIVPTRGRAHPNLFWYSLSGLRGVLRAVKPAIVDVHEEPYSLAIAGVMTAVRREAPEARMCVYTAQNILKRYPPPFTWIEDAVNARAIAAYPCSTEAGEVLRSKGFRGEIRVIPLGVRIPGVSGERRAGTRVGFVGRLEPYKGGAIALEAFADACRDSDAVLEFIGTGSQQEALRRQARAAGVAERVVFRGALPQDETLKRIGTIDVLLMPSLTTKAWKEQFGRVAAQALAAGTIVIASDSGSLQEVVDEAGILAPEGDVSSFSIALNRVLRDPRFADQLRERGRRRAREEFSWERVAEKFSGMYEYVLSR